MAKFVQIRDTAWVNLELVSDITAESGEVGREGVVFYFATCTPKGDQIYVSADAKYAVKIIAQLKAGILGKEPTTC